jgi:hypothetical protein
MQHHQEADHQEADQYQEVLVEAGARYVMLTYFALKHIALLDHLLSHDFMSVNECSIFFFTCAQVIASDIETEMAKDEIIELDAVDVKTFAEINISQSELCGICQQDLSPDGTTHIALQCGHVYHRECIETSWIAQKNHRGWCPNKCTDTTSLAHQDYKNLVAAAEPHTMDPDSLDPDSPENANGLTDFLL